MSQQKNESIIRKAIRKAFAYPNYGILFIFCMCVLFGALAFGKNLWLDEIYTIAEINLPYLDIININVNDVHPPGYYIGLKFLCNLFGYNLVAMHIFSLIPCIGMLLLGMFPIRKGFGESASKWFMFLCLTMPFMMWYSNEIRMYSWALFLTTAAFVYAARIIQEGKIKNWVLYFVFGILAAYTHYYALLGVAVIQLLLGLYLIVKERKEIVKWLVVSGLFVITYLPWLFVILNQLSSINEGFWITTFNLLSWIGFAREIFSLYTSIPYISGIFLAVIAVISVILVYEFLISKPKGKKELILFFGLIVILVVSVITTVYSLLIQPILLARYIMILSGIGLFFFAVMLPSIRNQKINAVFAIILILATGVCFCGCFTSEYTIDKEKTILDIQGIVKPDDLLIYDDVFAYGEISYYLRNYEHYLVADAKKTESRRNSVVGLLNGLPVTPDFIVDKLSSGKSVYLIKLNGNKPSGILNEIFSIREIKGFDVPQTGSYEKLTIYSVTPKLKELP